MGRQRARARGRARNRTEARGPEARGSVRRRPRRAGGSGEERGRARGCAQGGGKGGARPTGSRRRTQGRHLRRPRPDRSDRARSLHRPRHRPRRRSSRRPRTGGQRRGEDPRAVGNLRRGAARQVRHPRRDERRGGRLYPLLPDRRPRALQQVAHAQHPLHPDDAQGARAGRLAARHRVPGDDRERVQRLRILVRQGRRPLAVRGRHLATVRAAHRFLGRRAARSVQVDHRRFQVSQGAEGALPRRLVPGLGGLQRRRGEDQPRHSQGEDHRLLAHDGARADAASGDEALPPQADRGGAHRQAPRAIRLPRRLRSAARLRGSAGAGRHRPARGRQGGRDRLRGVAGPES